MDRTSMSQRSSITNRCLRQQTPCFLRCPLSSQRRKQARQTQLSAGKIPAEGKDDNDGLITKPLPQLQLAGAAVALSTVATLCLTVWREPLEDILYSYDSVTRTGLDIGDGVGTVLWALSLWYCSPVQLLLLFLGRIDTDRPSDWVLEIIGRATGQPVEDVMYTPPILIRLLAYAIFGGAGAVASLSFSVGLGDATWAISTGIGACMAAGVYEVGRPVRMAPVEAQELDVVWRDFASFAGKRLQRSGGCHESEIYKTFLASSPKYTPANAPDNDTMRDLVRNWHPDANRSSKGFYRNLSVIPTGPAKVAAGAVEGAEQA